MKNKHFINFIHGISEKPGMYAVNRVEDIGLVILGYRYAPFGRREADLLDQMLIDFRAFVNNYYGHTDDSDWVKLIRFYSGSDINSREIFADLFNKFLRASE